MKIIAMTPLRIKLVMLIIIGLLTACGSNEETAPPANPDAPLLDAIGDQSVLPGNTLNFVVSATDPNGDDIIFSTSATGTDPSSLNPASTFTADPSQVSASYTWSPSSMQTGDYVVNFTVTDNSPSELSDSETITITVLDTASQGRILYRDNCYSSNCHTFEDQPEGRFGIGAPTPAQMQDAFGYVGAMSNFQGFFTQAQLQQMTDYFCTLPENNQCLQSPMIR